MYLSFETFRETPPEAWDDDVAELGGTVFHSSHWAELQRRVQGTRPVFIYARGERGRPVGAALGLYRQSRHPMLGRLLRGFELPSYPVARDGDSTVAGHLIEESERIARHLGCARIRVNSNFSGSSNPLLMSRGYETADRVEFEVDLSLDSEALWKAVKKDQRDRIRKLTQAGVNYAWTAGTDAIDALGTVRETALDRRAVRNQGFSLPSDPDYYEKLYETLIAPGAARLLLASQRGAVIAAILYATFARKAYSVFSGSDEEGYKLGAQSGLFWYAVTTFKEEGFLVLNRGGVPAAAAEEHDPLHGIYRFKQRLGTTPVRCVSGERVLSPIRDRIARLRELVRRPAIRS
jgi:Acetyltransferase (GNAT) domain